MEYKLLLERKSNFYLYIALVLGTLALTFYGFSKVGWYAIAGISGLLLCFSITPFLINRYKFFLYIWFFGLPLGLVMYSYVGLNISSKNPIIFLILALTLPFATILFVRDIHKVVKNCPYIKYLIVFNIIVFLNFFRPGIIFVEWFEHIKFVTFAIFLVMCSYCYFEKEENKLEIINIFAVWVLINAITGIIQKVTGFGLMIMDGFPRAPGLVMHPNGLGGIAVLYLCLYTYLIKTVQAPRLRLFYNIVMFFSVCAVFITLNKNAIVCMGIISLFFFSDYIKKNTLKTFLYMFLAGFTFLLVDQITGLDFINNVIDRFTKDNSSFFWRFEFWGDIIRSFTPLTYLIGQGPGALQYYLLYTRNDHIINIHNAFIELLGTYGVFGLSMFLFYVYFLIDSFKALLTKEKGEVRELYKLMFLITLTILLRINFDEALWSRVIIYPALFFLTVTYLEIKAKTSKKEDSVANI